MMKSSHLVGFFIAQNLATLASNKLTCCLDAKMF